MIRVFRATLGERAAGGSRGMCSLLHSVSATGRLNSETQKLGDPMTAAQVNQRSLPILCYMSALLCEHGRFDEIRRDHQGTSHSGPCGSDR